MKTRIFLVASLMVALLAAVPAQAQDTSFYFSAKGGLTLQRLGNMEVDLTNPGGLTNFSLDNSLKLGAGANAAFGYDLYPYYFMPLRVELEVGYLFKSEIEGSNSSLSARMGTSSFIAQANFYFDMHNTSRFTPYIGGGLGFARNWADGNITIAGDTETSPRHNVNNLAWNASAGVRCDLGNNMGVELMYRYQGLGKVRTGVNDFGLVEANLGRHNLFLGVYVKI